MWAHHFCIAVVLFICICIGHIFFGQGRLALGFSERLRLGIYKASKGAWLRAQLAQFRLFVLLSPITAG